MSVDQNEAGTYEHKDLRVGDSVVTMPGHALRSGATWYPYAVVVQVDPLILISEDGDMKWSAMLDRLPLKVTGRASTAALNKANMRLWRDQEEEKRVAAEKQLEGLPIVYRVVWTESEAGMGQRPDGVSYSISKEHLQAEIKRITAAGSRECYSFASEIGRAFVTPELFAEIKEFGTITTPRDEHDGVLGLFVPIR